jgi:hypothetical protein
MTQEFEAYLSLDPRRYEGDWIALLGDIIVAHGRNLRDVYAEALEKHPGKTPLFTKVPESNETLIL